MRKMKRSRTSKENNKLVRYGVSSYWLMQSM